MEPRLNNNSLVLEKLSTRGRSDNFSNTFPPELRTMTLTYKLDPCTFRPMSQFAVAKRSSISATDELLSYILSAL